MIAKAREEEDRFFPSRPLRDLRVFAVAFFPNREAGLAIDLPCG
jgi:hypothetical protein